MAKGNEGESVLDAVPKTLRVRNQPHEPLLSLRNKDESGKCDKFETDGGYVCSTGRDFECFCAESGSSACDRVGGEAVKGTKDESGFFNTCVYSSAGPCSRFVSALDAGAIAELMVEERVTASVSENGRSKDEKRKPEARVGVSTAAERSELERETVVSRSGTVFFSGRLC